jgi:hypothetical protein
MKTVRDEPGAEGTAEATRANWLQLVIAWAIVGVPALWGVAQVVEKSLALFR